ncbi:hypothetical protein [Ruminiclostridium cellulolyticum]|uniref:Uncharacterized protein n=1 Tax=Ruminiclostridium cellulolyticum (strain ATCC 35319 / DSM 5812 / JCM 6584 / H10) TaxID=394503 RepID=B8I023_RUMCH|nr:hypothetical protein [Ruminiclostridium cellulolyticum]ACL75523.1 hypothetical protein Ccel_1166 [Ruminiclostridium cellulolyticum H10]
MDKIKKLRLRPIVNFKVVTILPEKENAICGTCNQAKVGNKEFPTLEKAIYSIDSPDKTTITLLTDVNLGKSTLSLGINTNIVLDLAGHKLTSTNCDGTIYLEGALTVIDSNEKETGVIENLYPKGMGIYFNRSGVLKLEGGTIKGYSALYNWSNTPAPFVIMNGGTLKGSCYGISYLDAANIIINNGTVQGGVMAFNNWGKSTHSFYIGESSYIKKGALLHSGVAKKYDATDNIVVVKKQYEIVNSFFTQNTISSSFSLA